MTAEQQYDLKQAASSLYAGGTDTVSISFPSCGAPVLTYPPDVFCALDIFPSHDAVPRGAEESSA